MTEDIVERLRESAEGWDDCGDTNNASFEREAADEIERLREHSRLRGLDIIELGRMAGEGEVEIEKLRSDLAAADRIIQRLTSGAELQAIMADNERLRAALMLAMNDTPGWYDLARAALSPPALEPSSGQ